MVIPPHSRSNYSAGKMVQLISLQRHSHACCKATVAAWNTIVTQAVFTSRAGPAWPIGRQHSSICSHSTNLLTWEAVLLPSRRRWQPGILAAFPESQKCQVSPQVKITSSKPVPVELFTPDLHGHTPLRYIMERNETLAVIPESN